MTGPRSLPPMPMLTTYLMRLPVAPFHWPRRTVSAKSPICRSTLRTPGITSLPSTLIFACGSRFRSAVCSTARPSVTLIFLPVNIFSISALRSAFSASLTSAFIVAASMRFLE